MSLIRSCFIWGSIAAILCLSNSCRSLVIIKAGRQFYSSIGKLIVRRSPICKNNWTSSHYCGRLLQRAFGRLFLLLLGLWYNMLFTPLLFFLRSLTRNFWLNFFYLKVQFPQLYHPCYHHLHFHIMVGRHKNSLRKLVRMVQFSKVIISNWFFSDFWVQRCLPITIYLSSILLFIFLLFHTEFWCSLYFILQALWVKICLNCKYFLGKAILEECTFGKVLLLRIEFNLILLSHIFHHL